MPYRSRAQAGYFHTHKAQLEAQGVNVAEWDRASKGRKLPKRVKHKKTKIIVKNKSKDFGSEEDLKGGKHLIKINRKMSKKNPRHKGYPELADTIFHETYHAKHPKATEKQTYKKTRQAIKKMGRKEKKRLYSMLPK